MWPSPGESARHEIVYIVLSARRNEQSPRSLKLLLAANKRLNIAHLLKESLGQLCSYQYEP